MSFQAMDWDIRTVQGIFPTQKLILICLANHAGPDGTRWPSETIVSDYFRLSREAVNKNMNTRTERGKG